MSLPVADAAAGASGKGKTSLPSGPGAATDANSTTVKKNWESLAKEAVRTAGDAMKNRIKPACLRLAFYDALSYHPSLRAYGPRGAIRLADNLDQDLRDVVEIINDIRAKHENVRTHLSYADLFQLIGVQAVKVYSNMDVEFDPGRQDVLGTIDPYMADKRIEASEIKGNIKASDLRSAFYLRGFNDKEIVALSSAIIYWMNPSLFRSGNSGTNNFHLVYEKLLEQDQTKDTKTPSNATTSTKNSGTTSTSNETNPTISFSCWKCLLSDKSFRSHIELFKENATKFDEEYKRAHKKLSEIGFRHFPPKEIVEYHDIKHGIAFGVAMTIIIGLMGFFYELMRS